MKEYYEIDIAGLKRKLPLCPLNDDLYIGAFVIFGDVELTEHSAAKLLESAPEFDVLITAESKGIPLIHEMAKQSGKNTYVLARKAPKLYMKDIFKVDVTSITTSGTQSLYIDTTDVEKLKGKRVLVVDDVVSTGASLRALEILVEKAGGNICGKVAVIAEGDAIKRDDIKFIQALPLFDKDGNPIESV